MAKAGIIRIVQEDLLEHAAVRAWRALQSAQYEPERIEILKEKRPNHTGNIGRLVCRLVGLGPKRSAVIGKRCWQSKAVIERAIYEDILPHLGFPFLKYYGMIGEPANGDFCWLFVEDAGEKAYSDLLDHHRALGTQWLSQMHRFATELTAPACLPDKGPKYYLKLMQSTRDAILSSLPNLALGADYLAPLEAIISQFDLLESHWDQVEAFCDRAPQTLVHGDFVVKNLRVRSSQTGTTLLPFDWGEAGWGVPAVDLMDVDVVAYWSAVRAHWPWLSVQQIKELALAGRIFRCLDAICWELPKTAWLKKPKENMRIYGSWLAGAIQEAGLED